MSVCRIRNSFFVRSTFSPSYVSVVSYRFSIAPLCSRIGTLPDMSYVRLKTAWTLAVSTLKSKGFAMKSSPPMFIAMMMFMLSAAEEINMTGTLEIFLISLHQ